MICRVTSKVKLESGKWYQRKSLNGKGIECEPLLYLDCEGISTGFYRKDGNDLKLVMSFENAREVYPCKVVKVRIANKPDYSVLYLVHSDTFDFSLVVPFSDIGMTVFFSEAEALTARRKWLERK